MTSEPYDPIAESMPYDAIGVCILTGEAGENPDDCTTHKHEPLLCRPYVEGTFGESEG